VPVAYCALVDSEQPSLEQGCDTVHTRHQDMRWVATVREHSHFPIIAMFGKIVVSLPAVGVDDRSWFHCLANKRDEACGRNVGNSIDADPPEAFWIMYLHRDDDDGLLGRLASVGPFFLASDVALVGAGVALRGHP
jgi:hypothetical protein